MNRFLPLHRKSTGFSLLEVLIAVVVLSVGLLALAALQGALTRSSSEAKVRGRVAAMLTTRLDELRSTGYGSIPLGTVSVTRDANSTEPDCGDGDPNDPQDPDYIDCARIQAAVDSITVQQVATVWFGAASFASATVEQDSSIPQFKRVVLSATWTDASGVARTQSLATDVSSMALTNNMIIPPAPLATPTGGPIVRTVSPATAGVIPIAISTNTDGEADGYNATTNPVPELVGRNSNQEIVGTRFTVLNYSPSFGSSVVIQKRFDTEMVKCRCQFGAGGTNLPEIYQKAMWPAVWTGEGYALSPPESNILAAAPGQSLSSGPRAGVDQSVLCQECCRDHHDTGNTGEVRFDPERQSSLVKYDVDGTGAFIAPADGNYVDSCRLIRVDGFWRTASDIYERQHGLLETQPVANVAAKSGLPTDDAVDKYETFVVDYLKQFATVQTKYDNGQSMFEDDARALDAAEIQIPNASNADARFLHSRGLYVDYLEQEARDKLTEVLADNDAQGLCPDPTGAPEECVMPFLPFTTVNLTEITEWNESVPAIITVNERNLLSTTPEQPSGGRTFGTSNGDANAESKSRRSNSGIAVSSALSEIGAVDPEDGGQGPQGANQVLEDAQAFQVGAGNGPAFDVSVSGGGGNPFVFFTLGIDNNVECPKPETGAHHCITSEGTSLPQPGAITVSHYWVESLTPVNYVGQPCSGGKTVDETGYPTPTFYNYVVTVAQSNGQDGTIAGSVNDGKASESTTINFGSIALDGLVTITLALEGSPIVATVASCTSNGNSHRFSQTPVWNKPWTLP